MDSGEAKLEFEGQEEIPSSWFVSSLEEGEAESTALCPAVLDWRTEPYLQTGKKLRQLELNFYKVFENTGIIGDVGKQPEAKTDAVPEETVVVIVENTNEVVEKAEDGVKPTYKRQTGKIKKKEGWALAANNRKVSSWLRNETRMKKEEREQKQSRRLEERTVLDMDWTDPVIDMIRN